MEYRYPLEAYTPPQIVNVKSEAITNEEVKRIEREFRVVNGAMNDLSVSAFDQIRDLQKNFRN